ncbi:hypothetical protein [Bacillus thuringiensis]|uniref:hypothetical protein n=1 Tax=Bacillus thuringiensis TaxID=1428 RepID=UPI0037D612C6
MDLFKAVLNELEGKALGEFEESLQTPAKYMYSIYKSFVEAGFSEGQAFELVKETYINAIQQNQ